MKGTKLRAVWDVFRPAGADSDAQGFNPDFNPRMPGDLSPYLYSEVFDLKPTSGLYSGSGVLEYWGVGGRMSAVRMNIERVGSVEESFSKASKTNDRRWSRVASTRDLPTIAFFRAGGLLRRSVPVPGSFFDTTNG